MGDKGRHPMTYNHYFTTTLQKQRKRKHEKFTEDAVKTSETVMYYNNKHNTHFNPVLMKEVMSKSIEQNMDKFSSEEALDNQRAYYKVRSLLCWYETCSDIQFRMSLSTSSTPSPSKLSSVTSSSLFRILSCPHSLLPDSLTRKLNLSPLSQLKLLSSARSWRTARLC